MTKLTVAQRGTTHLQHIHPKIMVITEILCELKRQVGPRYGFF